ncbi:MBL fold metallo-hydrolase [Thermodesulfobacteriota bacterium]
MQAPLVLGEYKIYWLNGGTFELDGGTMFGVVPKVLWEKKLPADTNNFITLENRLILIIGPDFNMVIETGIGNKLTEKQKTIFRVTREWNIDTDLEKLNLSRRDITHVVLTHCDFDHAGGIIMFNGQGKTELTFSNADHYIQQAEWEDVLQPNMRSKSTYWPINFQELIESNSLRLISGDQQIAKGITVSLSGGHTRGHQVVWIESAGEKAVHMGDLMPNNAYTNPLWVTPFDNFPLESVEQKKLIFTTARENDMWFLFYHDPSLAACKFNEQGEIIRRWDLPVCDK